MEQHNKKNSLGACTDFRLIAKDQSVLITRSMEFAENMQSCLISSPRGYAFTMTAPNGEPGMCWSARYGYLFVNGLHVDATIDGMNEVGLSFEYLFFPGEAAYQTVPEGKGKQALPYIFLGDWLLSQFKTVDEVKQALMSIYVFNQAIPGMGDNFFPLHAALFDASGKGIVVEYRKGILTIHDNEIGVMTNSPSFDWHMTNLRNYLNLSPSQPQSTEIAGINMSLFGQGAGGVGLPGDFSPPSRFIRTCFLLAHAFAAQDSTEALILAQHIINNVDIPIGVVRDDSSGKVVCDYTQWVVFKDLTNKKFYYRTYQNMVLRLIDLSQIDFLNQVTRLKLVLSNEPYVHDETKKMLAGLA
jgi:choloylglycine hydrolase